MSSELKTLEISNEIHLHTEITGRLKQTATDCKTREKERRCRWHGLHSWLISLILSLQFILNPANGFTESGLRDEFRLTFQYKSNLSYLFSLFSCNFSVCKIINSWKGGGWLQVHKIVPRQCDAVVEMLGLNVEWMEQGTERAKDENYIRCVVRHLWVLRIVKQDRALCCWHEAWYSTICKSVFTVSQRYLQSNSKKAL